jgi:hypothetical protein
MRRVLVYVVVTPLVAVLALLMPATPAAGWQPPGRPLPTLALVLDGMGFGYLPPGLGTTSDFAYHFQHVDFVARVWESQTHAGWTVDLDVDVMRGKRLTTNARRPRRTMFRRGSTAVLAGAAKTRSSGWCTPAWPSRSSSTTWAGPATT